MEANLPDEIIYVYWENEIARLKVQLIRKKTAVNGDRTSM